MDKITPANIASRQASPDVFLTPHLPLVAIRHDCQTGETKALGSFKDLKQFEAQMDLEVAENKLSRAALSLFDSDGEKVRFLAIPGDNIVQGNVGIFYLDPETSEPSVVGFKENVAEFFNDLEFLAESFRPKKRELVADLDPKNYLIVEF